MSNIKLICAIALMALVTYIIRLIPLNFFRKKITNPYIKSFLGFVPYSVLASMTFPDVFSSTGSSVSAIAGVATAIFCALKEKSLIVTAVISCIVVFVVDVILSFII